MHDINILRSIARLLMQDIIDAGNSFSCTDPAEPGVPGLLSPQPVRQHGRNGQPALTAARCSELRAQLNAARLMLRRLIERAYQVFGRVPTVG